MIWNFQSPSTLLIVKQSSNNSKFNLLWSPSKKLKKLDVSSLEIFQTTKVKDRARGQLPGKGSEPKKWSLGQFELILT